MEIQELQVFDAPNIFSLREPIVKLQVKLGELTDIPTKDIGNLNEKIVRLFAGIKDHKCAKGYEGGFVERLEEGTYLAHVTEHLCLETQRMLGYDIRHGKARQVKDDIYNVIFSCTRPEIGRACGIFVMNTLNALIAEKEVNVDEEIKELRKFCDGFDLDETVSAFIFEAKVRGIPVSIENDGELLRLGYGRYQKLLKAAECKDYANTVLERIYPDKAPFTIPVVSITGSNGKTTTALMISQIMKNAEYNVGTTTRYGIYINNKCMEEGYTTGLDSVRKILYNREVDAAVLETGKNDIVRDGLAYERADVAVFTNITQEQPESESFNTMEELLHVKSLVIEAVKDDGACILNADDPWIMKVMEKAKGKLVLFSLDEKNPLLAEHIKKEGRAVYLKDGIIYVNYNSGCKEVINVSDIPVTLKGRLNYNIYYSMAAIGACISMQVPLEIISTTLHTFSYDADIDSGWSVELLKDYKKEDAYLDLSKEPIFV